MMVDRHPQAWVFSLSPNGLGLDESKMGNSILSIPRSRFQTLAQQRKMVLWGLILIAGLGMMLALPIVVLAQPQPPRPPCSAAPQPSTV